MSMTTTSMAIAMVKSAHLVHSIQTLDPAVGQSVGLKHGATDAIERSAGRTHGGGVASRSPGACQWAHRHTGTQARHTGTRTHRHTGAKHQKRNEMNQIMKLCDVRFF